MRSVVSALMTYLVGQTPPSAKPMQGIESGVFEIIDDYDTDTYRAVYTVKVGRSLYISACVYEKIDTRDSHAKARD